MKTQICFIRHGETSWNKEGRIQGLIDNLLSEDGIREAKFVANHLKENDSTWDIIISSPLTRAMETASIIKEALNSNIQIQVNNDLIERNFGQAEGVIITKELFQKIIDEDIIGLEKHKHLQVRVYNATINLARMYEGKKLLVVCHSHVIKALLIQIDNKYTYKQQIKNLSLNKLIYENDKLSIDEININIEKKDI